jgi:hypothetical protein
VGAALDKAIRDRALADGPASAPRILTALRQIEDPADDPDALRAFVQRTRDEGADVIKLFATTGIDVGGNQSITDAQIQATCRRGEGRGTSHPLSTPSATPARARPSSPAAPRSSTGRSSRTRRSI